MLKILGSNKKIIGMMNTIFNSQIQKIFNAKNYY